MGLYEPSASTLLYGGPGVGKSSLAVSSFWDWRKREQVADGKLITFGAEDNPALAVPEHFRQTDKGTSLRLTSPLLNDQLFLTQFDAITRRFILDAEEGHPHDVIVIDGLSEFDLLFEETYVGGESDNFAKWNALLAQMFSMMMRLTPGVIGCPVIMTARVMEKKKARQLGQGKSTPGDPGFMEFDYYPSLRGSFRLHLPHYFAMVMYMETAQGTKDGKTVPVHVLNVVRNGDFYVKNVFEHLWLDAGEDSQVVNPMWPAFWAKLTATLSKDQTQEES